MVQINLYSRLGTIELLPQKTYRLQSFISSVIKSSHWLITSATLARAWLTSSPSSTAWGRAGTPRCRKWPTSRTNWRTRYSAMKSMKSSLRTLLYKIVKTLYSSFRLRWSIFEMSYKYSWVSVLVLAPLPRPPFVIHLAHNFYQYKIHVLTKTVKLLVLSFQAI